MNNNVISFYLFANKLKYKLRTGFVEIGIENDRIESVAEHVYGCLMLSIAIDSEYELNLDMFKVIKMLALHETEEILMEDFTIRSNITKKQKIQMGKKKVHEITEGLLKGQEIENLLNEFNAHETKESKFCFLIDKLECDFQAKIYDLMGVFSISKAMEDLPFYGDRALEIKEKAKTASDFWIEYDKPKFENDKVFKELINEIQKIKEL